ncbi:MAG TPA: single-stranded-DNA-specific exonuclease RecJ [Candidatus Woesebacteria bacterium]|nr:single-stranded-DNA-specific exonuclease RecJ [Candidatus Woesebacteria bacterium]
MKWHIQSTNTPKNLQELKKILLQNRKIKDEKSFFKGVSPFKISLKELDISARDLTKIKKRLKKAKDNQEKIVIFGDYDADGISATAVLWQVLYAQSYNVLPFIPNRLKHGYGLSIKAINDLLLEQADVSLIITVDNGIVAHDTLKLLKKHKIDAIITDHHQKDEEKLDALAIFHSTKICGCALAWFLARELSSQKEKQLLTDLLALVAIATVTDLMPLLMVNRSLLIYGLAVLRTNPSLGLQHLFASAKIDQSKIDTYTLGFQIGPRINAMGRLANGMDALRLLCTKNKTQATELSHLLQVTNEDRQNLTFDLTQSAEEIVAQETTEKIIILSSVDYHEGIIGLMAGKMTEKYAKPSIVISEGPEVSKASARSLPGFNITEFIRFFKKDLLEVGGHPLAAGFALETKKIPLVKIKMQKQAKILLAKKNLEKILQVENVLPIKLLTLETVALVEQFAPFGLANPKPVFALQNATLKNYKLLGRDGEHLKLIVAFAGSNQEYEVLAWRQAALAQKLILGTKLNLAVSLDINSYRGSNRLQLILKDLKPQAN